MYILLLLNRNELKTKNRKVFSLYNKTINMCKNYVSSINTMKKDINYQIPIIILNCLHLLMGIVIPLYI